MALAATAGAGGASGASGSGGQQGNQHAGGNGGTGGDGGSGANGSKGGTGGYGGGGGGGAGGTVRLYATDLQNLGSVSVSGGMGGYGAAYAGTAGGVGRVLVSSNTAPTIGTVTNGVTVQLSAGPASTNGFIENKSGNNISTPELTGLLNGADTSGILNLTAAQAQDLIATLGINSGAVAPPGASGALMLLQGGQSYTLGTTTIVNSYTNYDMLLFVNLSDTSALGTPQIGVVQTGHTDKSFENGLTIGGLGTLGGLSASSVTVAGLPADDIWATLIPHANTYAINASVNGASVQQLTLTPGATANSSDTCYFQLPDRTLPNGGAVPSLDAIAIAPPVGTATEVYGINSASGALVVLNGEVGGTAALSERQYLSNAVDSSTPSMAGATSVAVSPDGNNVYVAVPNSGSGGTIVTFTRNATTGNLTPANNTFTSPDNIFDSLTVLPDGTVVASGPGGMALLSVTHEGLASATLTEGTLATAVTNVGNLTSTSVNGSVSCWDSKVTASTRSTPAPWSRPILRRYTTATAPRRAWRSAPTATTSMLRRRIPTWCRS